MHFGEFKPKASLVGGEMVEAPGSSAAYIWRAVAVVEFRFPLL